MLLDRDRFERFSAALGLRDIPEQAREIDRLARDYATFFLVADSDEAKLVHAIEWLGRTHGASASLLPLVVPGHDPETGGSALYSGMAVIAVTGATGHAFAEFLRTAPSRFGITFIAHAGPTPP